MIIHEVEQGSVGWYTLRLGIPTASNFHQIITPARGELSKSADKYMNFLIAETLLGRSLDALENTEWMERGQTLEPQAVRMYDFEKEVTTQAVGFITTDDLQMGASPDRLVIGKRIGVEIKCPSPQIHVGYMRNTFEEKYVPQVQGQMLVAELEQVDRYSFHPEFPPVTTTTMRDEAYIAKMSKALTDFNHMRLAALEQIKKQGYFIARDKIQTPVEVELEKAAGAHYLNAG